LPALLLIVAGAANMGAAPTLGDVAAYALAVVLVLVLVFDLMVLMRVPAFCLKRLGAVNAAENALVEFAFRVPSSACRGGMKVLFRVVLPYGLIAAFPTEVLFGEAGPGGWAAAVAVVAAFTVLMRVAWKRGLARYEGAGG
jgi:ABC-2 type transport system permease protein